MQLLLLFHCQRTVETEVATCVVWSPNRGRSVTADTELARIAAKVLDTRGRSSQLQGAVISRILSRSSCTHVGSGGYVKDLQMLGSDLRRTVLVDNDLRVFAQPDNGIHVDDFSGETTDHELTRVRSIIQELLHVEDVRKVLRGSLKLKQRQRQFGSSYSDFLDQLP